MITLYASGPNFGLPDASPFVIKAEFLLKLAKLPFGRGQMTFKQAPKGKIPYIADGDMILGDSLFIQRHLERRYNIDYSGGYTAKEQAIGWAASRMMEEHFYFLNVHQRWMVDENFDAGPRVFFNAAPAPLRPLIARMIRNRVKAALHGQGIGRHTEAERATLAQDDVAAIAAIIGNNPYLLGDRVSGADAGVFPFLWSGSVPLFKGGVAEAVRGNETVMTYVGRLVAEYFPDYAVI